jgi:type IV pilus assembly protein PilQ
MKKNIPWIIVLIVCIALFGYAEYARSAPPEVAAPQVAKTDTGHLLDISFDKIKGKERLTFHISKQTGATVEALAGNAVLVKMANIFVPQEFRNELGEGKLSNVINVIPSQKTIEGQQWAFITIALRERVPYSVGQSGQNVHIDFNVSSLEAKLAPVEQKETYTAKETRKKEEKPSWTRVGGRETPIYMGRKISLDFQDAPIKAVLRLLGEAGGVTIVAGEDVKGSMTVYMHKVPWDQALDTILEVQGLAKKQMGDVISVVTYERMKKDEADRRAGEEDRIKSEALARKAEQTRLEEKGKLRQVSIEAKIVEATEDFVRNLGVTWGGMAAFKVGSYSAGAAAGTNVVQDRSVSWPYPIYNSAGQPVYTTDTGDAFRAASLNYPASVAAPTFGLIIGGANAVLEAQLQALESTNQGKIISSPKVTTMDNVKATIKQGEEIPYITIDKDGNRSITFKEAVLKLDVKPKITPEETISMEIKATNDYADYVKGSQYLAGNPPINKSEVESKIVVQDGDTIVIGGIVKSTDQTGVSGVPWLSKIPILGWLFKTESIQRTKRQLMVFITPKIIKSEEPVGEKLGKSKGG